MPSAAHACVLEVKNLEKVFGRKGSLTRALAGISFAVYAGEFVAIMGPSGSGKSTLLNCISTIDMPTSGSIKIAGKLTSSLKNSQLAAFRQSELGFIFQDSNLLDTLSAKENIALPLAIGRVRESLIQERVNKIAQSLGVSKVLDKYPYQLSGGEKQRIAAARALVTKPHLVLADEPTGALDSKNAKALLLSLEQMNKEYAATVMMVTHDAYAASFARRVLFIRDGKLFSELERGSQTRGEFYDKIMQLVSIVGGVADAC